MSSNVMQNGNTFDIGIKTLTQATINFDSVDLEITVPPLSDIQATLSAGSVSMSGVSGVMNLQVTSGSIDFSHGQITGRSSFHSFAGSISFIGSLGSNGDYTFATNSGSIHLTLPADSAFQLDASTGTGSVNNAFGSNMIGNVPGSRLSVHTGAGSVDISRE